MAAEEDLPEIPPEEFDLADEAPLDVPDDQESPEAHPQSTKTVAFNVKNEEKKSPVKAAKKKTTRVPMRFAVPASAQEGLADLIQWQTEPRIKVMRSEVRHRRVLQYQVRNSTKRLIEARRGKSLEAMVKEQGEELAWDRKQRRRGFREFSAMAPLQRVHFTEKPAEQGGPNMGPGGGPPDQGGGDAPALGRRAAEVMQEMAKMQVNASQWFRAELQRQVESCPDLDLASSEIRKRQHLEQGRNGLQEVINTTWARVLGVKSDDPTSGADTRASMAPVTAQKTTYDPEAIYVDKVERWHRTLVWSQQFDFFDKRIEADVKAEDENKIVEEDNGPVTGSLAQRARRHRAMRDKPEPPPAVPSMRSTFDVADWTTTYVPKPPRKMEPTSSPKLGSTIDSQASYSSMPASWRKAVGDSAGKDIDLPLPSAVVPGGRSAQPSVLDEWSNEYYGEDVRGKSVLEHEDVLHTVNPELFPLQQIQLRSPTPLTPALSTSKSGPL
jgi:hypothetical protein